MCLIIVKPKEVEFDDVFLGGVYKKNKDGVGVMYAENDVLYYAKALPKSFADVKAFWEAHVKGRECVVHFRMQTHGHVDTTNCHPYEVLHGDYPLFMMHNGVLHTDNEEDPSKSDTYLYIKNYLRPMLEHNPEWFMSAEFGDLVQSHIGSGNKFVMLDAYGNTTIINEREFVRYNGALLSNTYAWDTTGTEFDFKTRWGATSKYPATRYNGFVGYEDDDTSWLYGFGHLGGDAAVTVDRPKLAAVPDDGMIDEVEEAGKFAHDLFETMYCAGLVTAYAELRTSAVERYYLKVGPVAAYSLFDMIEQGVFTDDELIDEITGNQ